MPSAWQKRVQPDVEGKAPQFDFDLAVVGGGVGGAYLVSRLHEEFVIKRGQAMPKVALFERSDKVGGRLMSGYGAGASYGGVVDLLVTANGAFLEYVPMSDAARVDALAPARGGTPVLVFRAGFGAAAPDEPAQLLCRFGAAP